MNRYAKFIAGLLTIALTSGAFAQQITITAPSTAPTESVGTPVVATTLDLNQSGSTTLIPVALATGIAAGQVVSGTNITDGTTVASVVPTAQVTQAANGSFAGTQKVIPMVPTTAFATGQQCHDNTLSTVIGDGNVIASIQAGVSITMTANVNASSGAADSITCDPVVTLSAATTGTDASGTAVRFYANATAATLAGEGTLGVDGGEAILGKLFVAGGVFTGTLSTASGDITVGAASGNVRLGTGSAPTIATGACGATTNGTIAATSRSNAGQVVIASAATTVCTVTFATAMTAAPFCVISAANAAAIAATTLAFVSSSTVNGFVITGSVLASTNWNFVCA